MRGFDLCFLEGCSARTRILEDVERIGIYAADVGRGRKEREEGGCRWGVISTYNGWVGRQAKSDDGR